ncbi:MAG TPA: hypothetical protein PLX89_20300 [Verrucomicrobiota bacterium]|nr:hypothetical protein [Verrucomicrobiales bacterium]HRI15343.1 hypothetical protein [Verrucomicrobiota bacterium]
MNLFHFEHQGKSARVGFCALPDVRPKPVVAQKTSAGPVARMRLLNGINCRVAPANLRATELIEADPELALEDAGRRLDTELTAAYFDPTDPDPKPVGDFKEIDILFEVNGAEKERRPHLIRTPNLNTLHPVKLGRRFPMAEALTQFVFRASYQLRHQDGLTLDFLYQIAKELHEQQQMALLGAGPKGNLPLVVREKGSPYRAFLYGEIGTGAHPGEYKLVVMLSDQELKRPAQTPPEE